MPWLELTGNCIALLGKQKNSHSFEWEFHFVRPKGFEPLTFCSVDRRSIQLSYGRIFICFDPLWRTSNNYTGGCTYVQIEGAYRRKVAENRFYEELKRVPVYVTFITLTRGVELANPRNSGDLY